MCVYVYVQKGSTCLIIASERGQLDVVRYLVGEGGQTLLMMRNNVSRAPCHVIWDGALCFGRVETSIK